MEARLEVLNLHLWRGDRHLLRGVHFAMEPGDALQLLWPNGAGKTSLLRCIAGFLHAEEGTIRWRGVPVDADRDAFHWDMAYLGHETALKADLTAMENLHFACALRHGADDAALRIALQTVGLAQLDPQQPARSLSAGQRRRLALARLSLWGARLWLLDEPASNLDVAGQAVLATLLGEHLAAGGMAILATHASLAVESGRWQTWGSPAEKAA
ncbi:MAG TPA: cytochrome c biogenesis heme-transporting ATPase CcmA [Steroidobacteraceae bacterium]|nr:cytochrome c biogenesis heme-transporting ATPase CcmA [Steroidobacteraceae bacterium]